MIVPSGPVIFTSISLFIHSDPLRYSQHPGFPSSLISTFRLARLDYHPSQTYKPGEVRQNAAASQSRTSFGNVLVDFELAHSPPRTVFGEKTSDMTASYCFIRTS